MSVTSESLETAIQRLYKSNSEALLVGSLGRSAVFSRLYGDPEHEFVLRGERPLWNDNGSPRDLDFIISGGINPTTTEPYKTDIDCFTKPDFALESEGTDWWVTSIMFGYAERLHPAVMEPTPSKTIYDIDCLVPPIQTFQRLTGVPIIVRKKDKVSLALIEKALEFETDKLPEELYKPIDDLKALTNKGIYPKLVRTYNMVVPLPIRLATRPYIRGLKESINQN